MRPPSLRSITRSSARAAILLGLVLAAGCARRATPVDAATTSQGPDGSVALRGGPWGTLRVIEHVLEPPDPPGELTCGLEPDTWRFGGMTKSGLEQLLADAEIGDADWLSLVEKARCDAAGCTLLPPIEVVARMGARAREVVYGRLASVPDDVGALPLITRWARNEELWNGPGVPAPARALIRERSFRRGDVVMFLDLPLVCRALEGIEGARAAQRATLRALARAPSLMMQIHVDAAGADPGALAAYWGEGGREAEVRPMLESLARVPGGAWVDVTHLLPRMARTHLYRYPSEDDPPRDCHWSAFNFFREPPDDALVEPARVNALLSSEYDNVDNRPPRLGDILLFVRKEGDALAYFHSAVYVADDVVFTKNGRSARRPWELMRLSDVRAIYYSATEVYRVRRRPAGAPAIAPGRDR